MRLEEDSAQAFPRAIAVQQEVPRVAGVDQNSIGDQGFPEIRPSTITCVGPDELATGGLRLEQGRRGLREVGDELAVVLALPNKTLHILGTGWLGHFDDSLDFAGTGSDSSTRHQVPQILYLLGSEGTLIRVQLQVSLSQGYEKLPQLR